jgi:hypothetical protein
MPFYKDPEDMFLQRAVRAGALSGDGKPLSSQR